MVIADGERCWPPTGRTPGRRAAPDWLRGLRRGSRSSTAPQRRSGTRSSRRWSCRASGSAGWPRSTAPSGGCARRTRAWCREVASLVSAQVELSALAAQEERLAQAELRALRAQISPHFIYNALAAVANSIHTRPEEARELLTEFAEFTRYAFRGNRSYVTLADELHYVEKYLRLEQARFGDRLDVRVSVAPGGADRGRARCCRCSRWWRTPCATASSRRPGRAASRSSAPTSTPTSS